MLLVAGENGIGKRTPFDALPAAIAGRQRHHHDENRRKNRRRGWRAYSSRSRRDYVDHEQGQMVRNARQRFARPARNTMGVKLMDLRNGEKLQAIAPVVSQVEEEEVQKRGADRAKSRNCHAANPDVSNRLTMIGYVVSRGLCEGAAP